MSKTIRLTGGSRHEGLTAIMIEGQAEIGTHPNVYLAEATSLLEAIKQLPSGTSDRVLRDLLKAWFDEHVLNMSQETYKAFDWTWRKICDGVSDSPHT
jgi:hypothetical protein